MNYILKNDFYTLTVSDSGAETVSLLDKEGHELLWQSPSADMWSKHAPLLFPICGRILNSTYTYGGKIYNMGAHGFLSKRTFSVVSHTDTELVLADKADEETLAVYPFGYEFVAKYSLSGDEVRCEYEVKNAGGETMPYMFGLHPAFALPTANSADIGDFTLDLAKDEVVWIPLQHECFASHSHIPFPLENGGYALNEAEIYKNDTMIFTSVPSGASLLCEKNGYALSMNWSENLPFLCVWKEPNNAAKFICLEPWSDIPANGETPEDFATRKMHRLSAGESEKYFLNFSIKF